MYLKFKGGKSKVFTLSYDDGVVEDIRLVDIMNKHSLKGTFNINSALYLPEETKREKYCGRMKLSEAKNLFIGSGHEIAVHGLTHPFLERLNAAETVNEILCDRKKIESDYGVIARGMAYPFGTFSADVIQALRMCGIAYSRTTNSTEKFNLPESWLTLNPTCHHNNPRLFELAEKFLSEEMYTADARMFYVWGHSYEFRNDDNWEVFERLAEKVGDRQDVWYATNIEIYDYVRAYRSLAVSVDARIIHNGSAIDVWACDNDGIFVIPASKTVYR